MSLPRARAHGYEAVTRADGPPIICTVCRSVREWWLFVNAKAWGQQMKRYEYGPWTTALEASNWKKKLHEDLQTPAGDAQAVLERWKAERPWERHDGG